MFGCSRQQQLHKPTVSSSKSSTRAVQASALPPNVRTPFSPFLKYTANRALRLLRHTCSQACGAAAGHSVGYLLHTWTLSAVSLDSL